MRTFFTLRLAGLKWVFFHLSASLCNSQETRVINAGGGTSASASYEQSSSIGMLSGVSDTSSSLQTRLRMGFPGLLYEIDELLLSPQDAAVSESSSIRLFAEWLARDGVTLAVSPGELVWFALGGPVSGATSSGIVATTSVYQNASAVVAASGRGLTGYCGLQVLDSIPDNHRNYALDGIDDDWQVSYFGEDNPSGTGNADPDGDGHDNRFEFAAGLSPLNAASRFSMTIQASPYHPRWKSLVFSPRFDDRNYMVLRSNRPDGPWSPLSTMFQFDQGSNRTITDTNPPLQRAFYRLEIRKP